MKNETAVGSNFFTLGVSWEISYSSHGWIFIYSGTKIILEVPLTWLNC